MKRVFLIVLDSVGVGEMPDAEKYGDAGANTVGHIVAQMAPALPNMRKLGLGFIPETGLAPSSDAVGAFGVALEASAGKDTTTGHWEMAGLKLDKAFPTFPNGFPDEVIHQFEEVIGTKTLGNYASSGTVILDELGEEHAKTGFPIVYTSADSVFQIAANEKIIPVKRLYEMCEIARNILQGPYGVGRVIARPFIGDKAGDFTRTPRRRDFSLEPCGKTVLDLLCANGKQVLGVGKIEDIFCHRGLTASNHAAGNPACLEALYQYMAQDFEGLCFVNLVDFDMVYGHRRDTKGYANALEAFDRALPQIMEKMTEDDLLIITADHGCDPTFHGTDHTRERVPLLVWNKKMTKPIDLGIRNTFADTAATVCEYFNLHETFGATSYYQLLEG